MFTDPGEKLKSFASFIFKAGMVVVAIYAVLIAFGSQEALFKLPKILSGLLVNASSSSAYKFYSTLLGLLAAIWNAIVLGFICWLVCLLLSAFGESIEMKMRSAVALQRINLQLERKGNGNDRKNAIISVYNNTKWPAEKIAALLNYSKEEVESALSE